MQHQIKTWSKRAHHLQLEKEKTKEEHEMELVTALRRYDAMVELKDGKINPHRDDIA